MTEHLRRDLCHHFNYLQFCAAAVAVVVISGCYCCCCCYSGGGGAFICLRFLCLLLEFGFGMAEALNFPSGKIFLFEGCCRRFRIGGAATASLHTFQFCKLCSFVQLPQLLSNASSLSRSLSAFCYPHFFLGR